MEQQWFTTERPDVIFENTTTGRLKKQVWEATDEQIDQILEEYGIPSAPELGKAGTYIQNTPRYKTIEKRKKNDVILIPIGCTENHGIHNPSGLDTFMVTQICEGVRRYTAKQGREVGMTFTPLNFGGHPYHHIGMPGTVIMPEEVVRETLIYTMLGLWDDGYRKMILVNNHGHLWMLESAVQEFFKRYQLPAFVTILEWHRAVREFFYPSDKEHGWSTHFIHADEAETAVANLLFPEMVDMSVCVDAQPKSFMLQGHYDTSVDSFGRPHRWSEAEGHNWIERFGTPEGVVGKPSLGTPDKAKRPIAAILKYITLMIDEILEAFPPGQVPPCDKFSYHKQEDIDACLKEPLSEGWKSVHELPKIGIFEK
ncbi:3-dehydro-scyllo-inosose hydrolase [Christensenella timonensis]|uniref:3-dehydro-scyllo-inosose hydrolase n=1 Tax=Christensenella timonensis TaxID=1816678 RepID=UPI0009ECEC14|nr:3-dehydro-scyllo-inosose hydrolase [Christensenella timonensis]